MWKVRLLSIKIAVCMVLFFVSMISEARADVLNLRNGRSIEGLVKKADKDVIVLDVGFGTVTFHRASIDSIDTSSPEEALLMREEWKRQRKLEKIRRAKRERELELERQRRELEPKEVGIAQDKEHIIVSALLNKTVNASLILDTGATLVLLSNNIAKKLGIDVEAEKERVKVQMADGRKVDAKFVVLDSIDIEDVEAKGVSAVILSEEAKIENRDGLLGMSFLSRFNFQIDSANKKLILEKR